MGLPSYEVVITTTAQNDLEGIFEYLLDEAGADIAFSYTFDISNKITSLSKLSNRGHKAFAIRPNLRRLVHESHAIYYYIQEKTVYIVRILHNRRDHKKLV